MESPSPCVADRLPPIAWGRFGHGKLHWRMRRANTGMLTNVFCCPSFVLHRKYAACWNYPEPCPNQPCSFSRKRLPFPSTFSGEPVSPLSDDQHFPDIVAFPNTID